MTSQAGFSLIEMLAAIFVLSLGAVAVSESISGLLNGWQRTDMALKQNVQRSALLQQIPSRQAEEKSVSTSLTYKLTPDQELVLATPRVDHDASCRFDLVARQCR
ncbi:MAG: prepilin-type N-terminal cleavage/methylation domain-containing protein [Alphaproteobacteria bacterium]|nr:prepilin-type N-terminal cleavage/methylation domain-containing protein [Alphaproteobacteria bacterium]